MTFSASLRDAWPFLAMIGGAVLWWSLGVQLVIYTLLAIPMCVWLLQHRHRVEIPPAFALLMLFIGWSLISALALTSPRYAAAWLMRFVFVATAFVVGLWIWSMLRRGISPRLFVWAVVAFWVPAILLALIGLFTDTFQFVTPIEQVLRAMNINDPFLLASTHAQTSSFDTLYRIQRPTALFSYTNQWGAGVGVMTPFAVYALLTTRSLLAKFALSVMLVLTLVVVVMSVNRGAWLSLLVALAYVLFRHTLAGNLKNVAMVGITVVLGGIGVLVSPLMTLIQERLATPNVSTRETLYQAALELTMRSPFFGYGAPQSSAGLADSNNVSVGTHGQIWTLLVSQGFIGAGIFVLTLIVLIWRCQPLHGDSPEVWLHSVAIVTLIQLGFYDVLPLGLILAFAAAFICATKAGRFIATPSPGVARLEGKTNVHVDA